MIGKNFGPRFHGNWLDLRVNGDLKIWTKFMDIQD